MILGRKIPLILHEDNQASKLKAMNRTHKLSIAAIHESIRDLGLELRYTESGDQLADLFTKVLPRAKFVDAIQKLRIGPLSLPK